MSHSVGSGATIRADTQSPQAHRLCQIKVVYCISISCPVVFVLSVEKYLLSLQLDPNLTVPYVHWFYIVNLPLLGC